MSQSHTDEFLRAATDARIRITAVSPGKAKQLVADGAVLLDVREWDEYEAGHIEDAQICSRDHLKMRFLSFHRTSPVRSSATAAAVTKAHWRPTRSSNWATIRFAR